MFRSDANAFRLLARSAGLPRQRLRWLASLIHVVDAYYAALLALGSAGALLIGGGWPGAAGSSNR